MSIITSGVIQNTVVFARQRGRGPGPTNTLILTIPNVLDNDLPYQVDVLVDQDSDGVAGADDLRCMAMLASDRNDNAGITVQVVDNTCTIRAELPSP